MRSFSSTPTPGSSAFSLPAGLPAGLSPPSPAGPHHSHPSAQNHPLSLGETYFLPCLLVSTTQSHCFLFELVLQVSPSTPIILSKYFFQEDGTGLPLRTLAEGPVSIILHAELKAGPWRACEAQLHYFCLVSAPTADVSSPEVGLTLH